MLGPNSISLIRLINSKIKRTYMHLLWKMMPKENSLLIIRADAVDLGTKTLTANVLTNQKPEACYGIPVASLRQWEYLKHIFLKSVDNKRGKLKSIQWSKIRENWKTVLVFTELLSDLQELHWLVPATTMLPKTSVNLYVLNCTRIPPGFFTGNETHLDKKSIHQTAFVKWSRPGQWPPGHSGTTHSLVQETRMVDGKETSAPPFTCHEASPSPGNCVELRTT